MGERRTQYRKDSSSEWVDTTRNYIAEPQVTPEVTQALRDFNHVMDDLDQRNIGLGVEKEGLAMQILVYAYQARDMKQQCPHEWQEATGGIVCLRCSRVVPYAKTEGESNA